MKQHIAGVYLPKSTIEVMWNVRCLFKIDSNNTKTTPWRDSNVSIINFEQISYIVPV